MCRDLPSSYLYYYCVIHSASWFERLREGGPCQITKKSQGTNVSSVVFFTCIYLCIHLCYRFPHFLTKSASDSVVLTHLNSLSDSKPTSVSEKKLSKLFVIALSNMSLLSSHFTFLLTLSTSFALYPLVCKALQYLSHAFSYSFSLEHSVTNLKKSPFRMLCFSFSE